MWSNSIPDRQCEFSPVLKTEHAERNEHWRGWTAALNDRQSEGVGGPIWFALSGAEPIRNETVIPATQNQPTLVRCDMLSIFRLPTGGNSARANIAAAALVPSTPASRPQRIETAVITARNSSNSIDFDSSARKNTQEAPAIEQQINTPKKGFSKRDVRVQRLCIQRLPLVYSPPRMNWLKSCKVTPSSFLSLLPANTRNVVRFI